MNDVTWTHPMKRLVQAYFQYQLSGTMSEVTFKSLCSTLETLFLQLGTRVTPACRAIVWYRVASRLLFTAFTSVRDYVRYI